MASRRYITILWAAGLLLAAGISGQWLEALRRIAVARFSYHVPLVVTTAVNILLACGTIGLAWYANWHKQRDKAVLWVLVTVGSILVLYPILRLTVFAWLRLGFLPLLGITSRISQTGALIAAVGAAGLILPTD